MQFLNLKEAKVIGVIKLPLSTLQLFERWMSQNNSNQAAHMHITQGRSTGWRSTNLIPYSWCEGPSNASLAIADGPINDSKIIENRIQSFMYKILNLITVDSSTPCTVMCRCSKLLLWTAKMPIYRIFTVSASSERNSKHASNERYTRSLQPLRQSETMPVAANSVINQVQYLIMVIAAHWHSCFKHYCPLGPIL